VRAIVQSRLGGPEVLEWVEIDTPVPGPGEVLVALEAIGVNYIETYHRRGIYGKPMPFIPGAEAAGTVAAVGDGVSDVAIGDQVASVSFGGSYAEYAIAPAGRVLPVPEAVGTDQAAAVLLQGMTAHYLCHDSYRLEPGDVCLIHAGAGGVGRLLIQMAKMLGATVIATAGGPDKVALATSAGADDVIDYLEADFVAAVEQIAGPRPLATIYDGVGEATFEKGLGLLRPRGTMVVFGQASGVVPPFDVGKLATHGSLYVTRPTLGSFISTRADLEARAGDVFGWMADGELDVRIPHRWPLREAAAAHTALEARQTTGKILLEP
jgi:NADPH2:quinone reductase